MNVAERVQELLKEREELARTDEKLMHLAGFLAAIEERARQNQRTEQDMIRELAQEHMLYC